MFHENRKELRFALGDSRSALRAQTWTAIEGRSLPILKFSDSVGAVSRSLGAGLARVPPMLPDQTGRAVCVADEGFPGGDPRAMDDA